MDERGDGGLPPYHLAVIPQHYATSFESILINFRSRVVKILQESNVETRKDHPVFKILSIF